MLSLARLERNGHSDCNEIQPQTYEMDYYQREEGTRERTGVENTCDASLRTCVQIPGADVKSQDCMCVCHLSTMESTDREHC